MIALGTHAPVELEYEPSAQSSQMVAPAAADKPEDAFQSSDIPIVS